jgi:AraC-like DNA-binding protein
MKETFIRHFFTPIQPAVKSSTDGIAYLELSPDLRLSNYIYCYWQLNTKYKLANSFSYRVIPDSCIDIFFDKNNVAESRVMGFSTASTEFELGNSFHYIGIRFLPSAFPSLFRLDAAVLTNREENLHDVVPSLARDLIQRLDGQHEMENIKNMLDLYFLKKVEDVRASMDKRLVEAIISIMKSHGSLNVQEGIDAGISPRQLRRLFEFYVGNSPKMFSKVVRFQYFFQLLNSSQGSKYHQLLLEAGYYDQPHFNKDFKSFFGLTPGEVLKK